MRILLSTLALTACANLAHAADPGGPYGTLKDEPVAAAPFNWAGLYVGAHGGWARADFDFHTAVTTAPDQESKSAFGGAQIGLNSQRGNVVVGLEADVSFGDLTDKVKDGKYITQDTEVNAFGSARVRLGYAFDFFLPYVTGGLGWADVTAGENCPPGAQGGHCKKVGAFRAEDTQTYFGWTLGAGLELAISQNLSMKAEYLYADLGSEFFDLSPKATPRAPDLEISIAKIGVNYKFSH